MKNHRKNDHSKAKNMHDDNTSLVQHCLINYKLHDFVISL